MYVCMYVCIEPSICGTAAFCKVQKVGVDNTGRVWGVGMLNESSNIRSFGFQLRTRLEFYQLATIFR